MSVFAVKEIQAFLSILHPGLVTSSTVAEAFQGEAEAATFPQSVRLASAVSSKILMLMHSDASPFLFVTRIQLAQSQYSQSQP